MFLSNKLAGIITFWMQKFNYRTTLREGSDRIAVLDAYESAS